VLAKCRKDATNAMEAAKDAGDKSKEEMMNCKQLAIKVSSNSVYGFTGVTVAKLPCLEIAQSVTAYGREMIMMTKDRVETPWPERGWPGAKVVYGDTDSVMVRFDCLMEHQPPLSKEELVTEATRLGKLGVHLVNEIFANSPLICLTYEKLFFPYLLFTKKRYALAKGVIRRLSLNEVAS
jgi:DNA polymerase delta subunit 1